MLNGFEKALLGLRAFTAWLNEIAAAAPSDHGLRLMQGTFASCKEQACYAAIEPEKTARFQGLGIYFKGEKDLVVDTVL